MGALWVGKNVPMWLVILKIPQPVVEGVGEYWRGRGVVGGNLLLKGFRKMPDWMRVVRIVWMPSEGYRRITGADWGIVKRL